MSNDSENYEFQDEEIEAMSAIYGDDFTVQSERVKGVSPCTVALTISKPPLEVTFLCHLPDSYPTIDAPFVEIIGSSLGEQAVAQLTGEMQLECPFSPGMVVLFVWAEWLKSKLEEWAEERKQNLSEWEQQDSTNPRAVDRNTNAQEPANEDLQSNAAEIFQIKNSAFELEARGISIIHGEPFTDRKSTFQAHLAVIRSEEEARLVVDHLLQDRKIARATHNIMAYRVFDEEKNIQYQDNDDDGETAAAGRMAEMMTTMGVNNVIVVVSRWYGGIHLGPDRFRHINNCARVLLEDQGLSQRVGSGRKKSGNSKKKNKR